MRNSLKILESVIKDKKSFIVNYGDNIKELTYWDNEKKLYKSETGYWSFELLYQIARGEVENTIIELNNKVI